MIETWHKCVVCGYLFCWIPKPNRRRSNACSPRCRHRRHTQKNEESRQRAIAQGCPPDKAWDGDGLLPFQMHVYSLPEVGERVPEGAPQAVNIRVREHGQTITLTGRVSPLGPRRG
jgi:hypothetical protein